MYEGSQQNMRKFLLSYSTYITIIKKEITTHRLKA